MDRLDYFLRYLKRTKGLFLGYCERGPYYLSALADADRDQKQLEHK